MWKLIKTINATDPDHALDEKRLEKAFDKWWEVFDHELKAIREKHKTVAKAPERTKKDLLAEILDNSRAVQRAVERLESREKLEFPFGSSELLSATTPAKFFFDVAGVTPPQVWKTLKIADFFKKLESEKEAKKKAEKEPEKESDGGKPPTRPA